MRADPSEPVPRRENNSRSLIIVALCFALAVAALIAFPLHYPHTLDFRLNPYGLLSLTPVLVNIWIIIQIIRLRTRTEESVWFMLYISGVTIAALGEGFQRFSIHPASAIFWFQVNGIGFLLLPISYYLFVFSYARSVRSQSPLLIPSLIVSAFVMITLFVGTNQFYDLNPGTLAHYPWGYNPITGPAFPILLVWTEMLLFVALLTLIRFNRRTKSELLKRQSWVFILALLIPTVGGSLTDGILPMLSNNSIVPLSTFLSAGTGIIAYYGLRKYRLFQINPADFAENVIRTMHEAVIVTDRRFAIDFVNKEAERLLGATAADLAGKDLSRQFDDSSWRTITANPTARMEHAPGDNDIDIDKLQITAASGEHVPVRVYTSRLDVGTPNEAYIFIIADISDITASYHKLEDSATRISSQNVQLQENQDTMARLLEEAKNLQVALRREKENVERTVEVRTAELRDARDKLQASEQMKSEFIMLSSHNLRTPLTIMKSSVEILTRETDLTAKQKETIIHGLASSTDRLGEFIEDLLTIATLEAGDQLSHTPARLEDIITPLIEETEQLAATKDLAFVHDAVPEGIVLNANVLRLRGAVRNVLHNAVSFTDSGEIRLHVETADSMVRISVSDTGIGISAEELPQLFTKFHRATPALTSNYQGEGIGLYLTKLVVEEHHGHITGSSTPGQGSSFTIELPYIVRN